MKSSQSYFNSRSPSFYLTRSYLIATLPGQWLRQPCLPQHPFLPLCHHSPLHHYCLCHPPDPLDPLELEDCHPQRCQLQNHLLLLKVYSHHFHFLCSLHSKKSKISRNKIRPHNFSKVPVNSHTETNFTHNQT